MSSTKHNRRPLYIPFSGPMLLESSLLNKGSAFDDEERKQFNLEGMLPSKIETIEEQAVRSYKQYCGYNTDIERHIFLRNLQDINQTLFFYVLEQHLEEMMPIIYTPTVGEACQVFSQSYRRKHGMFVSYEDRDRLHDILQNVTKPKVKIIVVTDGERILGLGDLGIGGMAIPIGKLSLYTACGGISPAYTLAVTLDVGCNNPSLLNDPLYMGWRHARITGEPYYEFIDKFIEAVRVRWPDVLLQFEDFAQPNAQPLLDRYRDELCCFNDDIQGTAAVVSASLLAACRSRGVKLSEQTLLFAGAGSAGCGIAAQLVDHMVREGVSAKYARSRIVMLSAHGLLTTEQEGLQSFQLPFAKTADEVVALFGSAKAADIDLLSAVRAVKPSILIGVSGAAGIFTQDVVQTMTALCENPVILPLSNPTSRIEGRPEDILQWSDGKALVATGSPFDPVAYNGQTFPIVQCNNCYIFPGLGLGVIAAKASRITQNMIMASSEALASCSPMINNADKPLLPPLAQIQDVSKTIALAVYRQAIEDGVTMPVPDYVIEQKIKANFWRPEYRTYRRISF